MPGTLFIVTAPSGAGKTTLVSGLLERDPLVRLGLIHHPRAAHGRVDGQHYHFIDVPASRPARQG
jgi:guanylate kinase